MRAEDRRMISWLGLAVALPHSAISPTVRPQPVQTLEPGSRVQICLQRDGASKMPVYDFVAIAD